MILASIALHPLLAQQAPPPGGGINMLLIMLLFMAGMYFLLIAPQRRKQKRHEQMVGALQAGDSILTTGGMYGVIAKVKNDRFIVKIDESTKVEMNRNFIQNKIDKDEDNKS